MVIRSKLTNQGHQVYSKMILKNEYTACMIQVILFNKSTQIECRPPPRQLIIPTLSGFTICERIVIQINPKFDKFFFISLQGDHEYFVKIPRIIC